MDVALACNVNAVSDVTVTLKVFRIAIYTSAHFNAYHDGQALLLGIGSPQINHLTLISGYFIAVVATRIGTA